MSAAIVNIHMDGDFAGKYLTIWGPRNGELHVTVHAGEEAIKYSEIYSNQTSHIELLCDLSTDTFAEKCRAMNIYASDVTDMLNIRCVNNGQCENTNIWCPLGSTSKCNIRCFLALYRSVDR